MDVRQSTLRNLHRRANLTRSGGHGQLLIQPSEDDGFKTCLLHASSNICTCTVSMQDCTHGFENENLPLNLVKSVRYLPAKVTINHSVCPLLWQSNDPQRSLVSLQAWWRAQATRRRYTCLRVMSDPWKHLLQSGEAVAYASICLKHDNRAKQSIESLAKVFLILTTHKRLLWCSLKNKRVLDQVQLGKGETECCDLGSNAFSVSSSLRGKGCYFNHTFTELLTASFNWITNIRELPTTIELHRVNRRNSLRGSNFPILCMGYLSLLSSSSIKRAFGFRDQRFTLLHGCRLVSFPQSKGAELEVTEIDQFTSIEIWNERDFTLRTINGSLTTWSGSTAREATAWATAIQKVIDARLRGSLMMHRS